MNVQERRENILKVYNFALCSLCVIIGLMKNAQITRRGNYYTLRKWIIVCIACSFWDDELATQYKGECNHLCSWASPKQPQSAHPRTYAMPLYVQHVFFCVPLVLNLLFSSHFWTWMSTKGKKICFCSFLKHKRLLWLMIGLSSSSDYEALLPFCLSFSTSFITSSGLVNQLWCPQCMILIA